MPTGYNQAMLTIGMHYNNPVCRGTVTLNGNELFSNFGLGEMTSKIVIRSRLDLQRSFQKGASMLQRWPSPTTRATLSAWPRRTLASSTFTSWRLRSTPPT